MNATAKGAPGEKLIASNRKAFHDYHVLERFDAGLVLLGTEIKSLREGRANLSDSYVAFQKGEAYLLNAHISPYTHGNRENHEPLRSRKLLLHRRELDKLEAQVRDKGLTIVPLRLFFRGSVAKVEIAVVRGKQLHDKRETERTKEADREAAAAMKHGRR
ncbi:MAG TPA: SsrA-binding protein SmpB [Thermoanaerobaculia bacterium]|nr:SsrA-binding protein SmpB [Thermoanaerobaculia bacterium]